MSTKKQVSGRREVNTYVFLHDAAKNCKLRGVEKEKGSMFMFMSSLLFSAFTLEAYSNHVGPSVLEYWDELDHLPVMSKFKIIHHELELKFDRSRRPLQTVKRLFTVRNLLAHGKSHRGTKKLKREIKYNPTTPFSEQEILSTEWEKACTAVFAERAITDVTDVITTIHKTVKTKWPDAFFSGDPPRFFSEDPFLDAGWTTIKLPKD